MTDGTTTPEDPRFETDETKADRASQQGLGMGERELEAQRDPNASQAANADDEDMDDDQDTPEPADGSENADDEPVSPGAGV